MKNNKFLMTIGLGFCVAISALIILWGIFRLGILVTDDGDWMIIRLSAFYQSLREGQFPVRFLGRLNYHYGYPVANFLYPGYLYIGSLLHAVGVPFSASVEYITIGSVVVTAVCIFIWLSTFFSSKISALASLGYVLSPYLVYDIYRRGSVGEILSGMWISIALLSIDRRIRVLLAPTIACAILSHNTIGLLGILCIAGYALVRGRYSIMIDLALGIAMASFFWMPALFEQRFVTFGSTTVSMPQSYFGISSVIVAAYTGMVIPFLILISRRVQSQSRELVYIAGLFLVAVTISTKVSAPLWSSALLGSIIQFPFRALFVSWFAVPYLLAASFSEIGRKRFVLILIAVFIPMVWFGIPYIFTTQSIVREEGFYTTNESTTTVKDEYMPRWVQEKPASHSYDRIFVYSGNAVFNHKTISTQRIDTLIHAKEDSVIQINTIFYPGWGAQLNGRPVQIDYDNNFGVMRIHVPTGTHRLFMEFRETVFRFATIVVSFSSLIIWIIYLFTRMGINRKWFTKVSKNK